MAGQIRWGYGCEIGVYAQHVYTSLPEKRTVLEYLEYSAAAGTKTQAILDLAGSFLFRGEHVKKPISVLSGGERARLCLAGLLLSQYNVLVLDEPGNHLDVDTVDALAEALIDYQGTVMFTSHDRHFMKRVATAVVEVRDGRVVNYRGDYDAYLYYVNKEIEDGERDLAAKHSAGKAEGPHAREDRKQRAQRQRELRKEVDDPRAQRSRGSTSASGSSTPNCSKPPTPPKRCACTRRSRRSPRNWRRSKNAGVSCKSSSKRTSRETASERVSPRSSDATCVRYSCFEVAGEAVRSRAVARRHPLAQRVAQGLQPIDGSPASCTAISTYCSVDVGDQLLQTQAWPGRCRQIATRRSRRDSVTTGTPCHRQSQVVVWPLNGNGSSAMSSRLISSRYCAGGSRLTSSNRSGSIPDAANVARRRAPSARRSCRPRTSRRDRGTRSRISAQAASTSGVTLAKLLNEPNVT